MSESPKNPNRLKGRVISQKAQRFEESVIRGMTRLSQENDAINLSQGFPGGDPAPEILEAAHEALRQGFNQYAITWGAPQLRKAVAEKVTRLNGIPTDPETMVTITCGATEAMIASMLAVIDPGDEVIIFEPYYENYNPDTIISGATPKYVALRGNEFKWDSTELREAFNENTRAIIINTPHNPSGRVFTRSELEEIASLCQEYDCLAITDEIYEYILYDGRKHVSIGSLPGMEDRTITIGGLSKSYNVTGWRLAYAIASPDITDGVRKVHDFLTVGAPHPLQIAGVTALALPESYYENLRREYDQKREILTGYLERGGFNPSAPEGSYFILCNIKELIEALGVEDDNAFALHLVTQEKVAGVPGSSFYSRSSLGSHLIRFHFAAEEEVLHEAGKKLEAFGKSLLQR